MNPQDEMLLLTRLGRIADALERQNDLLEVQALETVLPPSPLHRATREWGTRRARLMALQQKLWKPWSTDT